MVFVVCCFTLVLFGVPLVCVCCWVCFVLFYVIGCLCSLLFAFALCCCVSCCWLLGLVCGLWLFAGFDDLI